MNTAEGTLAEQSVGMRGAGTSGREILCKLTLSQEGTCFDTVLKILLLIILALMPLVVIIFWLLHFPEPNKFALANELSNKFFVGQCVVQKREEDVCGCMGRLWV